MWYRINYHLYSGRGREWSATGILYERGSLTGCCYTMDTSHLVLEALGWMRAASVRNNAWDAFTDV